MKNWRNNLFLYTAGLSFDINIIGTQNNNKNLWMQLKTNLPIDYMIRMLSSLIFFYKLTERTRKIV